MTRVGFYVVQDGLAQQRLTVAARLAAKAFAQGHRIFINAAHEAQAQQLDELLWSFQNASFLPHALAGAPGDDVIAIGWGQEPANHDDLLINLQLGVPRFFSRFARVAEVVTQDDESLQVLRKSWTFYKERGYALEKHDL